MLAKVCSAAVNGIEAYPVEVEVNSLKRGPFLGFVSECKSFKEEDGGFIRTDLRTIMLVQPMLSRAAPLGRARIPLPGR
jgi:hypothetical protein